MIYPLFAVKDVVVGTFYEIKAYPNNECALRTFDLLCAEAKFPKDLQFFKLGTYNIETGEIDSCVEFLKAGGDNE